MNDSLNSLGEALANGYHDKLNEWSALMKFSFTADDLSASFGLADDIMRLEEKWEAFAHLVPTLQTDYLPEDLLAVPEAISLPPEQQVLSSQLERKIDNYPFIPQVENSVPFAFPGGLEESIKESKATNNLNFPAQDNAANFWETSQTSGAEISKMARERLQSAQIEKKIADYPFIPQVDTSVPFVPGALAEPIKEPSSPQAEGSSRLGNLSIPVVQASSQTPAKEMTDQTDNFPDSIWTQPLQNLGNFARRINYSATERNENIPSLRPEARIAYGANHSASSESMTLNESTKQTSAGWIQAPLPGQTESLSPASPIQHFESENQSFQQVTPLQPPMPDPDDLLEALTDRIIRDFRRFYP